MKGKHDTKTKKLLKKWREDVEEAERQVKIMVKERKYSEAQKFQTKAVYIELCMLELEELYDS